MTTVIFSHGKESGPWGSKITTMSKVAEQLGFRVESIDYQDLDSPEARVDRLVENISQQSDTVILVGSSMGGYVSLVAAERTKVVGVFLLAPALSMPGYEVQNYKYAGEVSMVHGWHDDIVPAENSINYARTCSANLLLVHDVHRLSNSMPQISPFFRNWLKPFDIHRL